MSKTKEVLIAIVKSKPLYGLIAIGLVAGGVTQGEAIAGLLGELMQGLPF